MNKVLTLENPIKINGETVRELPYDVMKITALQFSEACARSSALDKTRALTFKLKESDYSFQLYLGFQAIIAVNPKIDISDLERIEGYDILNVANIGMLFMYRSSGGASQENSSDVQSENIADTSIQALPTQEN